MELGDNIESESPLYRALWDSDFSEAKRLIAEGANIDDCLEDDGDSHLHRAAEQGDLEMVEFYLGYPCPRTLEAFNYIDHTPLMMAAKGGKVEVVSKFLDYGVDPDAHCEEKIGNTAIREAVREGHADIVEVLLKFGADPTIPGWMGISAVDQAFYSIEGGFQSQHARRIQKMLRTFPSKTKDKYL